MPFYGVVDHNKDIASFVPPSMLAYFQYPTLSADTVCFVSADALWKADRRGGQAQRLTSALPGLTSPFFSPDGQTLFFVSAGDLFRISVHGGIPERLTYENSAMTVVAWQDGPIVASFHGSAFSRESFLYLFDEKTRSLVPINCGPGTFLAYGPKKGVVLQRDGYGYITWKRYTGGTAGKLWIDKEGNGDFVPLFASKHNLLRPLWIGERIYFLSDYEGKGNLYSCTTEGEDIRRHTHYEDFYVRQTRACGEAIVFDCGGLLYVFDTQKNTTEALPIDLERGSLQTERRFKNPETTFSHCALSPKGDRLAITTRGRVFQATPFKGPVSQKGKRDGVRYRHACWLHKDYRMAVICDDGLDEVIEIHGKEVTRFEGKDLGLDWGRLVDMLPSPCADVVLCTNHRHELILLDFAKKEGTIIARSPCGQFRGFSWSPCGRWLVYASEETDRCSAIYLYSLDTHKAHVVAPPCFQNFSPVFDAEGKHIYFLSARSLSPQYESLRFDLSFKDAVKPYVVTLSADGLSPFIKPLLLEQEEETEKKKTKKEAAPKALEISLEGLSERIEEFPIKARNYERLHSLKGQLLLLVRGQEDCHLYAYDWGSLKEEEILSSLCDFTVSADNQWLTYSTRHKLRTVRAGSKPDDSPDTSFHGGGWFDWDRLVLSVSPQQEWIHMFKEAWRLQRDFFWTDTMGGIDWDAIYHLYRPCIDRIASLSELYSVIGDMHGELGTSHAYILGKFSAKNMPYLGAEIAYNPKKKAYEITQLLRGDRWKGTPLLRPGVNVTEGDLILAVGGQEVSVDCPPQELLMHQGSHVLPLLISDKNGKNKREVVIDVSQAVSKENLHYRAWVEKNCSFVHKVSKGKAGYVHIPDMQLEGFSEFLRSYVQEYDKEGLIIDARYNGGGNVSTLILDYLTRKRLGYDQSRWQGSTPYPIESPRGPMVALINGHTGSDGDIFSHAFSALNLGPLVGKRTWGGVVGILPRYDLIDGTCTSQPEYSFWFHDLGWKVENYGVDPTIEVEMRPQDYAAGRDVQLEKGLEVLMGIVKKSEDYTPPPLPSLAAPRLPT